jgi:hypothetical protein
MFQPYAVDLTPTHLDTPQFFFSATKAQDGNTLHTECHYVARASEVMLPDMADYNAKAHSLRDYLENGLFAAPSVAASARASGPFSARNWIAWAILAGDVLLVGGLAAWLLSLSPSSEVYRRSVGLEFFEGIGGWLILVVINLVVGLAVHTMSAAADFRIIADDVRWHALTTPGTKLYDAWWGPSLIFEQTATTLLALLCVLALVLMFMKRFTFPALTILIFGSNLLFAVIDHSLVSQIAALASSPTVAAGPTAILRSVGGCAIWIPYLLRSRRVRATFVN